MLVREPALQELLPAFELSDALGHVSTGRCEGEHWLASFAVYLLTEKD